MHARVGLAGAFIDAVAAGTFAFLLALPLAVAADAEAPATADLFAGALALGGVLVAAAAATALVLRSRDSATGAHGAAARGAGVVLAVWLGVSGLAGGRGERLLAGLGDPGIAVQAIEVLVACAVAALVVRWVVPWLARSRPLDWPKETRCRSL